MKVHSSWMPAWIYIGTHIRGFCLGIFGIVVLLFIFISMMGIFVIWIPTLGWSMSLEKPLANIFQWQMEQWDL